MHPPAPPPPEVRSEVQSLLMQSPAFKAMPPARQQQIARDTATVAGFLAKPNGIPGNRIEGGVGVPARALVDEGTYDANAAKVSEIGNAPFVAGAAREAGAAAGLLMQQVNFPTFVGGLVTGVFQAIVKSSIEQMEAYSSMIASVSKSLGSFMEDNVSENQGRDHMVEKFPDLFDIGVDEFADEPAPRLRLKEGVDEAQALRRINASISFEGGALKSADVSDENTERALVVGARMQLAKQRQQLMASIVLMGINRIVVTDGKISAKVMYDFKAQDARKMQRSAQAFDYARNKDGSLQQMWAGEGSNESGGKVEASGERKGSYEKDKGEYSRTSDYSADSYAKGTYKYEAKPVMTAMSAATEASEASLQTRANLAGAVEINFKSDYLPLDKMATPGMIAAIQGNSTPVDPNVLPSARVATPPALAPAA